MSAKLTKYINNVDYCWYDSSNILFSECIDVENELKTLYVTFNNGGTYMYENVNVNDYILFKHDLSQGKAFHKLIKKYDGKKIELPYDANKVKELYTILIDHQETIDTNNMTDYGMITEEEINTITENTIKNILYGENNKIYNINITPIPEGDVPQFLETVANNFKRTPIVDPLTGQLDLRKLPIDVDQEIFIGTYPNDNEIKNEENE